MNVEKKLIKNLLLSNTKYSLFRNSEKLIVALSGGKDSMSLLKILAKLHPLSLLYPLHIYPYKVDKIVTFLQEFVSDKLSIPNPLIIDKNPLYNTEENCYICARGRRKRIFELAEEKKISKIVLGHTKNDMAETFLMNILYSGNMDTLRPFQDFFNGKFQVIRPFYLVESGDIIRYSKIYKIELQSYDCKGKKSNKREVVRAFIKSINDKKVIDRIFLSALKANNIQDGL